MRKRIVALSLCALLLLSSLLGLASCSRPPEYAEIQERFIELVESSYSINKVLFGTGLPTYKRVYDRTTASYKIHGDYYYYEIDDDELGKIIAYRLVSPQKDESGKLDMSFSYLLVLDERDAEKTAVYEDKQAGKYYYDIEYTEKTYDFYYSVTDPENYDYVSLESEYKTIDSIKIAAEAVYSKSYLEGSVYEALFTGVVMSEQESAGLSSSGMPARYMEYMDDEANIWLMQSNTYPSLVTETRIFDFSTAKVVRPGSKKVVNIEVETYLESSPEDRLKVRITMVLVDGEWYLDSGTY